MPVFERPDGVQLWWEEQGEGAPAVIFTLGYMSPPGLYAELTAMVAETHRTVVYDLRGCGMSSRDAPITADHDIEDLLAVIEEVGPPVVLVGIGDGGARAARTAARAPDQVKAVVTIFGNPLGRAAAEGTSSLAASQSVGDLYGAQLRTDYRGALNSGIGGVNDYTDAELKARIDDTIAYVPQYAAVERFNYWVGDPTLEECRSLGSKLWMIESPGNEFFSIEISEHARELAPEATVEVVEDGPISAPATAADWIRRAADQ